MSGRPRELFAQLAIKYREIAEIYAELACSDVDAREPLTSRNCERRFGISRRRFAAICAPLYRARDPRVRRVGKDYIVLDLSVLGPQEAPRAANDGTDSTGAAWDPRTAKREAGLRPRPERLR